MPSSTCNDARRPATALLATGFVIGLAGCASSAPPLPRLATATTEPGYVAPAGSQTQPIAGPPGASASPTAAPAPTKPTLMVGKPVWDELTADERARLAASSDVRVLEPDRYGMVMDVQGADNSTPGTNAGAALGGAAASAMYLDRGIRGNNYSATAGLAIGLLGAALGSSMDSGPVKSFQFRYTVQLGDGEVRYFDESKSTSFRHSVGVCLTVPDLTLVSVQVCRQTAASLRQRLLSQAPTPTRGPGLQGLQ